MVKRVAVACVALSAAFCARGPAVDTQRVPAMYTTAALPTGDPGAPIWRAVPEHPVTLMVQDVTEPRLTKPGVSLVKVRALHDGRAIVFRLEWVDATRDLIPESGRSSDAVAMQFAVAPGADMPNAAMGEAGKSVEICYWKAVWQDDVDRAGGGVDRVAALYPNMAVDSNAYPFANNPAAKAEMERRYAPAAAAGNPVTVLPQSGAVQQMLAEGFGTSSVPPEQHASGRGVWADKVWAVTMARPLREGTGRNNLEVGKTTYTALAVWDGAERQTGSRKMRSGWVPLFIEAAKP